MNKQLLNCLIIIVGISFNSISAQEKEKIYLVETENSSMVFTGEQDGKFKFQYYGEKVDKAAQILKSRIGMNEEAYTTFGLDCIGAKALRATHADGNMSVDLYLKNVEQTILDDNVSMTTVRLYDNRYPFYVDLNYKAYYHENVIEIWTEIFHKERKPVTLYKFASFSMPVRAFDPWLVHFHGSWANEFNMTEEKLQRGTKEIRNREGIRNTRDDTPTFMISLDGPPSEKHGEVIGGALAWSGTYKISFNGEVTNRINIVAGMNEEASQYILERNEKFETPKLILTYSNRGKGQVSRNLHRWVRNYQLIDGESERKILLNSWEGVYFDITEDKMVEMIDDIAEMGGELFVMDDGWFGDIYQRNNASAGLGDWKIDRKKLPNGLEPLIDRAREKNILFGIWLEPEMLNVKSELYEKHPDWVVQQPNREIIKGRGGAEMLLDLSNPKVQDFVYHTVHDLLVMYPEIAYIKWDANHFISNYGSNYLPGEKQSHLYIEYHRGLLKTLDRVRNAHPDLIMQACASGGGRVNYAFLPYFNDFWLSDNTDAISRLKISWGVSHFFPAIVQGSNVSQSPNHQTGRELPLKFRCDIAMAGRFGLEMQPSDLTEAEKQFTKQSIAVYKEIRQVVQFGDQYRLISPYQDYGMAALMYVSEDKNNAVSFFYSLDKNFGAAYPAVKLEGLDPDKQYRLTEINTTDNESRKDPSENNIYNGEFLMNVGLSVNMRKVYQSRIIELTVVD